MVLFSIYLGPIPFTPIETLSVYKSELESESELESGSVRKSLLFSQVDLNPGLLDFCLDVLQIKLTRPDNEMTNLCKITNGANKVIYVVTYSCRKWDVPVHRSMCWMLYHWTESWSQPVN